MTRWVWEESIKTGCVNILGLLNRLLRKGRTQEPAGSSENSQISASVVVTPGFLQWGPSVPAEGDPSAISPLCRQLSPEGSYLLPLSVLMALHLLFLCSRSGFAQR